jgi:predicted O-methyltransferase YrrM
MTNYIQTGLLLALEALQRPSWAYHHLWGHIDERLLLRFHRVDENGRRANLRSLNEALCLVTEGDATVFAQLSERFLSYSGQRGASAGTASPIPLQSEASLELQQLVFCLTSLLRPDKVVEVGVGRGATTRAILTALKENQKGHLYSIDFPALRPGYAQDIGMLVTETLRAQWTLILGPSRRELQRLLPTIGRIELFVHDGAHSYYAQRADYEAAADYLAPGGVLISDDVNNGSFLEVSRARGMRALLIYQSKTDPIGLAFKNSTIE